MTNPKSTPESIIIPRFPTAPLDPTLRTTLRTALLTPQTIKNLRQTLDAATRADAWPDKVRQRVLQLLQKKECWEWEELVRVVVMEARGVEEEEADEEGTVGNEGEKVDIRVSERAVADAATVVRGVLAGRGGVRVERREEGKGRGFWD